ncbi:signal transduction histidine kinase [Thermocatellispora tengchongensis]|uniref:histidine kinase n=1 Tax=Thermocatellispora tengchongensis TaxID=1073253 RepID=A0A840NUY6_9ACTN|nr:histidine kinase [Thermocatellispora tengchongensis]MBB5130619.1 signal transduction histidine kinase [Thermocatellispora tengchongensis]
MSDALLASLPPLVAWLIGQAGDRDGGMAVVLSLACAQSLALMWSRRFPLSALSVVVALELTLALLKTPVLVAPLVAASRLGAWGRGDRRVIGVVAVLALLLAGLPITLFAIGDPLRVVAVYAALALLFVGFWAVGRVDGRQRDRIRELQARSRALEAEREQAERRAAERERALLARELHDILNHSVTTMVVDAEAAADTLDGMEETLRRVARTGRESLAELRRLLGVLRETPGHDPLSPPPKLDQLEALVAAVPPGGPRVVLEREGDVRQVDTSIELAAYRVVQEALTNVAKHAGPVDVRVVLAYAPARLTIRVANPLPGGPGAIGNGAGVGLIGMRERVELLGGSVRVTRGPGSFEVCATLPLRSVT